MRILKNILIAAFLVLIFVWLPNVAGATVQVPVVTPPVYCPPDASGYVSPYPCTPSVVIGPGPLRCLDATAPLNNPTCPAVRAKVERYRADDVLIAVLLKNGHGCFPDWPTNIATPPNGITKTVRHCGRSKSFKAALRSIRLYRDKAYEAFAISIPAGDEPGV